MTRKPPTMRPSVQKTFTPGGGVQTERPGPVRDGMKRITVGPRQQDKAQGPPRDVVLARFIRLCSAIFSTTLSREAAALTVNRISELARVDRAILVQLKGKPVIQAVTGGGAVAQDSAFADAVTEARRRYRDRPESVVIPRVPESEKASSPRLWKVQQAMGGTRILWLPLWLTSDNSLPPRYALWLERWHGQKWEKADIELLQHAALFLGHGLVRPRSAVRSRRRFVRWAMVLALLVFLALPVTSSVTTPVRVIPDQPHNIFAPMDGIVKDLLVRPGQQVEAGETLFRYDARVLDKRLEEAYRNVAVAKAKFARLEGAAHRDPEARAELPVQQLEVQRAEDDVRFFTGQRARAEVQTAKSGVIVLDDPDSLIGAAIQTGQAVLSVADPSQTKLRLIVPASDVGFLKKGARVSVRLDSNPLRHYSAIVTRVGFEVKLSDRQIPSVMTEAIWIDDTPDIQPGQKGTAKVYGETTLMGMQILRKPLIALRSVTGL